VQIFQQGKLIGVIGVLGDKPDEFRLPTAVSVSAGRDIFVLDSKHGQVKVFGEDLRFKRAFAANGSQPGQLTMPQGMTMDAEGNLWIADTGNHRVQKFAPDGTFRSAFGKLGSGPDEFRSPTGVAVRDGKVYVADNGNGRIVQRAST
jgi:DNA-binding beta-propeller fold protein YncE